MTTIEREDRHNEICRILTKTYMDKNADYGNSFGNMFQELGIITALTRIGDKFNRLKSLSLKRDICVVDESIRDTLMDMANYCIMTIIELDLQEEKSRSENA